MPESRYQLGMRTYGARQAYNYIRNKLPKDVIVQYDPLNSIDCPSGLYGHHQMAVADHSAYGAPQQAFQALKNEIAPIFQNCNNNWAQIDQNCRKHTLDIIIMNDLDPAWKEMPVLDATRPIPFTKTLIMQYLHVAYLPTACCMCISLKYS